MFSVQSYIIVPSNIPFYSAQHFVLFLSYQEFNLRMLINRMTRIGNQNSSESWPIRLARFRF